MTTDSDETLRLSSALASIQIGPDDASRFFELLDEAWQWVATDPDHDRSVDESESRGRRRLRRATFRTVKGVAGAGVIIARLALLVTLVEKHGPANWNGVIGFHAAVTLMGDGFPAAWVPDRDTLNVLANAADRPARQAILLDRREGVLAHARTVLSDVQLPELQDARRLVDEALACLAAFPAGAHSLALNAAGVVALSETGLGRLSQLSETADARSELLRRHAHEQLVADLPRSLLLLTVAPALTTYRPWRGDPVPTRPNRHAIAHSVSPRQFTEANALESVLLAVSVLRQAQSIRQSTSFTTGATSTSDGTALPAAMPAQGLRPEP